MTSFYQLRAGLLRPRIVLFWLVVTFVASCYLPIAHDSAYAQTTPPIRDLTIGTSGQGRPINAVQFGDGPLKLVIVGDTHGGPEFATHNLANELIAHFRANPQEVPANLRLYIIPTLNPDGLALGMRFNANYVDLNRNMNTFLDSCSDNDWSTTVQGAYGLVSDTGGPYPDSEVESRVIRNFLLDASGAIFLHNNAGLVFPAYCEHAPSNLMAQIYAEAANYIYARYWPNYMITGSMADWASAFGITSITPELVSDVDSEFEQNLAGIRAVMAASETLLFPPAGESVAGFELPPEIWRFWKAYGGEAVFGLPLEEAQISPNGARQRFTNVVLELDYSAADTPDLVRPLDLGRKVTAAQEFAPADPASSPLYFEQTGHSLREAFLYYWQRIDGERVLGLPISEEFWTRSADGQMRIVQYFERGALAYYPEFEASGQAVKLEPLGALDLQLDLVQAAWSSHQVR